MTAFLAFGTQQGQSWTDTNGACKLKREDAIALETAVSIMTIVSWLGGEKLLWSNPLKQSRYPLVVFVLLKVDGVHRH